MAKRKDFADSLKADEQEQLDAEEAVQVEKVAASEPTPAEKAVGNPDLQVITPNLIMSKKRFELEGRAVTFIGAHPSNSPGVKWLSDAKGNMIQFKWKDCEDPRFGKGAQFAVKTDFKDGRNKQIDAFLVRTMDEIQVWTVDITA